MYNLDKESVVKIFNLGIESGYEMAKTGIPVDQIKTMSIIIFNSLLSIIENENKEDGETNANT